MLVFSTLLFALSAVAGVAIAIAILNKKDTPKVIVIIHGALAATGLVLLAYYSYQNLDQYPLISLVLFIIAAIGGFILLGNDLKGNKGSIPLVFIHAGAAVIALVLLLVFVFT